MMSRSLRVTSSIHPPMLPLLQSISVERTEIDPQENQRYHAWPCTGKEKDLRGGAHIEQTGLGNNGRIGNKGGTKMKAWITALICFSMVKSQQVYENSAFNIKYTAPAGWAFDAPTAITADAIVIRPTRPGLPARPTLTISKGLPTTMFLAPSSVVASNVSTFYKVTGKQSSLMPQIVYANDSIDLPFRNTGLTIRQSDLGVESVTFGVSFQGSCFVFEYTTTVQDNAVNLDLYMQNYLNTTFLSITPTAKAAITQKNEFVIRSAFVDLLGRSIRYAPNPEKRITFPWKAP